MSRFLDALHSARVLLMDGAMGTELQRAGIGENECYELWNLTHQEKVRAIHQAYVDAGAEVLLTNTFQANFPALSKHGLDDRLEEIIAKGLEVARSVAGAHRFVLASFGPFALLDNFRQSRTNQIARMLKAASGADGWLFETSSDSLILSVVRKCLESGFLPEVRPVLFSWSYTRLGDGVLQTITRRRPGPCARRVANFGANVLGANCGRDIAMDEIIEIIHRYRRETGLPLFARPNSGTPTRVGDRWMYPVTPELMAERLPDLLEAGVSMVGGCCGTTPAHIAAMRPIVDAWNARNV